MGRVELSMPLAWIRRFDNYWGFAVFDIDVHALHKMRCGNGVGHGAVGT